VCNFLSAWASICCTRKPLRSAAVAWLHSIGGKPATGFRSISPASAADLRRFLVQQIEAHAERRLYTARMLEAV